VKVEVRSSVPGDGAFAEDASALIAGSADEFDLARRTPEFLRAKLEGGQAALALADDELVGFGYFSAWGGGAWVSHSGLVVRPDFRGEGVGRRLKQCLIEGSDAAFPDATTMSLTTSDSVLAMNRSLGFETAELSQLTDDPEFWAGCKTCRNYERVQREGRRCCCQAMIRPPRRRP